MSNKLHKKTKRTVLGFNKIENKYLCIKNKQKKDRDSIIASSFKDMKIIMLSVLSDKFRFGKVRLERFQRAINTYLENAATDNNFKGTALSRMMIEKYNINVQHTVNKIAFRDIIRLYYKKTLSIKQDEVYKLVNASFYNIFAISCTILKTLFKFSVNDINKFLDESNKWFSNTSNYEQYELTTQLMAEMLADERKYYDLDFLEMAN